MKKLEKLWLNDCNLTKFPKEIGDLTQLKELNFGESNHITDYSGLENLVDIEVLYLSNLFKSKIPKEVAYLIKLKTLGIYYASGKVDFKPLYELENLEELLVFSLRYLNNKQVKKLKKYQPNLWLQL